MKKLLTIIIFILAILIAKFSFAAERWVITSLDWQPYSGKNLPDYGNSILKLKRGLQSKGINLKVDFFPWARAKAMAVKTEYIGYFPAWPEEVNDNFIASPPIDWSEIAVMTREEMILPDNIYELFSDHTIGLVATYEYPKEISEAAKLNPLNVDKAQNEAALLGKLLRGRCDAAITDPLVMNYYAKKKRVNNIVVAKIVAKRPLVLAIRKSENSDKILEMLIKIFKTSKNCQQPVYQNKVPKFDTFHQ